MNIIDLSKKNLISKFLDGLFLNILLRVKGIIYLPILVNFFSKSDIGVVSLWQSISSLLMGLYLLNIPDSSNRVILDYKKNNNDQKITETISTIFSFSLIVFLIVSIILTVFYYSFFNNDDSDFFEILILLVFSKIVGKLAIFTFQIFQKSKLIIKTQLTIEYGSLLIVLFGIYILNINDIKYVIFAYMSVSFMMGILLLIKLYEYYPYKFSINSDILKKLLKISLFLLPNVYALIIIQNSDFVMIKYFWSLVEVGEYSFAYSIGSVVGGLSMAVTFFWYSSAVYADDELLSRMVVKINTYMPILLFAVVLFYYFVTQPLINLINSDYLIVNNVIQILIIGFFVNIFIQILSGTLYAKNKERLILYSVLTGMVINIILNFILIPRYGLYGGALATTIAYLTIFIIQYKYVRELLPKLKSIKNNFNFIVLLIISILYITINFIGRT